MNKIIAASAALALVLAACGDDDGGDTSSGARAELLAELTADGTEGLDEGCLEDKVGGLSDGDAQMLLDSVDGDELAVDAPAEAFAFVAELIECIDLSDLGDIDLSDLDSEDGADIDLGDIDVSDDGADDAAGDAATSGASDSADLGGAKERLFEAMTAGGDAMGLDEDCIAQKIDALSDSDAAFLADNVDADEIPDGAPEAAFEFATSIIECVDFSDIDLGDIDLGDIDLGDLGG